MPYQNTLRIELSVKWKLLLEKEYYFIGGGFIKCKDEGEPVWTEPPSKYNNMHGLRKILRKSDLALDEILLVNEEALTGRFRVDIFEGIDGLINTMCESVENGLNIDGILPGPIV